MSTDWTRQPTHRLYTVKGPTENRVWLAIGAAWPHKGEQGFTLVLEALPIDGRIVMREITAQTSEGGQA